MIAVTLRVAPRANVIASFAALMDSIESFASLVTRSEGVTRHVTSYSSFLMTHTILSRIVLIQICLILCARLDWPRSSDIRTWIWVCASMCMRGVLKNRWWWDKVLRHVQMYIGEDPGNRLLNKSKAILIWILSVTLVFLYFYFGN